MSKKKGRKKSKHSIIYQQIKEQQHDNYIIFEEESDVKITKSKNRNQKSPDEIDAHFGFCYPEIVWYLISAFIEPKDIPVFAAINKTTYNITKRESFWFSIYKRYCDKDKRLPDRLRIENNYRAYGLRQRIIRALYHTYDIFVIKASENDNKKSPHSLLKRICVNTWYCKSQLYWNVYVKFKKQGQIDHNIISKDDGRVDANPEENTKVLQICCKHVHNIPALMGMTLSAFSLSYQLPGLKLEMGFSNPQDATRKFHYVVVDSVIKWCVYDWWHPNYPHFDVKPPPLMKDEESAPLLEVDFFDLSDED